MKQQAAIIGGGVIGGGWAARFLLAGWDVSLYDPDPEAERKIAEVMANARDSAPFLIDGVLPKEGSLQLACTVAEAVRDASWIQESVPERVAIKQQVYQEIQNHCSDDAIIGSSTSGFTPTELQQDAKNPSQIVVTHPYNPVYLLPLVELVASPATSQEQIDRAKAILSAIAMKPVHIKGEIEAHVGDRLLEAVWREALWLINDDIATTDVIDDIMTHSFGMRWAQMGLFETYRVAGGEAGMRHFIKQFGPALAWNWTKLMDVPELTDDLIDKIASQSDAQSGAYSIRELEAIRDRNLVAFMRSLKSHNWAAGAFLNEVEAASQPESPQIDDIDISQPLVLHQGRVMPEWIDYNGHMTEYRYGNVFSDATDAVLRLVGLDDAYLARGYSYYTVETHIRHLGEAHKGDAFTVQSQLIKADGKKLHLCHQMMNDAGMVLATGEHLLLHVDTNKGASCVPEEPLFPQLTKLAAAQEALPLPDFCGRAVGKK
ncbi:MAG: carnitine 3-dehydrogenase [Candidatus Puniceispirillaceae bacterium]